MKEISKIAIALIVLISGIALAPVMGLPAQGFNWQRYAGVYAPADLVVDHASGQPGSFFLVTGSNFTPNTSINVSVNGVPLGSLESNDAGELAFIIDSTGADTGSYFLEATGAETGLAQFDLVEDGPQWPHPGAEDILFALPAGIAVHQVHMPVIIRE